MLRGGFAAIIGCAVLGACSLFTNLDGLSGGDAGDLTDGASDAPIGDAQADAVAVEASVPFCSSVTPPPFFCDDFDEGPLNSATWTPTLDDSGAITLDDASAVSPPDSVRFTLASNASGPCSYASVEHVTSISYEKSVRFAYDVLLAPASAGGFAETAMNGIHISAADGSGGCDYYVIASPTNSRLVCESSAGQDEVPMSQFQAGKWTHVEMVVDGTTAPVSATVTLDTGTPTTTTASSQCSFGELGNVSIGLYCFAQPESIDVRVDNVAIWVE